jgi:hypothetical protein
LETINQCVFFARGIAKTCFSPFSPDFSFAFGSFPQAIFLPKTG